MEASMATTTRFKKRVDERKLRRILNSAVRDPKFFDELILNPRLALDARKIKVTTTELGKLENLVNNPTINVIEEFMRLHPLTGAKLKLILKVLSLWQPFLLPHQKPR
jgi:hypothetical protein